LVLEHTSVKLEKWVLYPSVYWRSNSTPFRTKTTHARAWPWRSGLLVCIYVRAT